MRNNNWEFNLQLFADGVYGDAADVDTSAGVNPAAAGQEEGVTTAAAGQTNPSNTRTLEELGVPKELAERHRARKAKSKASMATAEPDEEDKQMQQAAAAETKQTKVEENAAPDWDELMKKPEYQRKMSDIVSARVKDYQKKFDSIAPMLELLGRRSGMDVSDISKLDLAALNKSVVDDDAFYEAGASAAGEDVETHKRNMQRDLDYNNRERELNRREQAFQAGIIEQVAARHQAKMKAEADELRKEFPEFSLEREMENPRFAAMVAPSGGFSVADAYYALHRKEIREQVAQQVQQALSRSIQSGRQIPAENGTRGKASMPVGDKLYSQMTKAEREAYKAELQRRSQKR